MMKKVFLIAVFCFFSTPATIFACSCLHGEPAHAFNDARLVFIGRMLGGTEKVEVKTQSGEPLTLEAGNLRFAVEEIFKGQAAQEFTVQVSSNLGTSCGPYGLRRGARYVVYAYAKGDAFYTGVCTRTNTLDNKYAEEDLKFLRNLPPAGVGGTLEGGITVNVGDSGSHPLADVRIKIVHADGQTITAFTNKDGTYKVTQLKPGKYKVEPDLPPNYDTENKSVEVEVDDRGKAYASFEVHIDGRVSGRAIDRQGNPFNSMTLQLAGEGKSIWGHSSGEDGRFEVDGTPPGEYVLFVEMQGNDYSKRKPYYYPGTFDRTKATVIRVGLGETVEGLEFRLPNGYIVKSIEGEVTWADGTPAANVEVALLCPQSTGANGFRLESRPTATNTDDQGRFRLEGVTGETYWLEARGTRAGKNGGEEVRMHSPARKISLGDTMKNVRLVLSKAGYVGGCRD